MKLRNQSLKLLNGREGKKFQEGGSAFSSRPKKNRKKAAQTKTAKPDKRPQEKSSKQKNEENFERDPNIQKLSTSSNQKNKLMVLAAK